MSSYLNKFIEVKQNGKWHLVKWNAIDKDGNYKQDQELSHGLILRDEFNWKKPGWEGLPSDATDELKELTAKNDERIKSVGWSCGYHYQWITLTELEKLLNDEIESFIKSIRENIKKQEDNKILDGIEELKCLIKGKTYRKKKKVDEDDEWAFYDSVDYNLDTEGYDSNTIGFILGLVEAVSELKTLGYLYLDDEFQYNHTSDDIRIIYYYD